MALYSLLYTSDGKLLEIGPAGTRWFRSTDPEEARKFRVQDNVELSEDVAAVYRELSRGGGGDGDKRLAAQVLAEDAPKHLRKGQPAQSVVDAAIAEVRQRRPH